MKEHLSLFLAFWGLGLLTFAAEHLFPARQVKYRLVLLNDIVALAVYTVCFAIIVPFTDRISIPDYVPAGVLKVGTLYKLLLFYIVEDLGLYWVHRLMHTQQFWRTHKWHHYPTHMYWLAGVRASIPHITLFNCTFVAARPLLANAPGWIFQLIAREHIFRNNWMHMNVAWRSNWLEWLVVTPRYHQIHHSSDPQHYRSNLGSLLTVWDRLFGTYCDPNVANKKLSFGIGEKVTAVRLVLGI